MEPASKASGAFVQMRVKADRGITEQKTYLFRKHLETAGLLTSLVAVRSNSASERDVSLTIIRWTEQLNYDDNGICCAY